MSSAIRPHHDEKGANPAVVEQQIERSDVAQVVSIGPLNSGKLALIAGMTDALAAVADYPFSTTHIQPAMLDYRDVQIQPIDTPPVTSDYCRSTFRNRTVLT